MVRSAEQIQSRPSRSLLKVDTRKRWRCLFCLFVWRVGSYQRHWPSSRFARGHFGILVASNRGLKVSLSLSLSSHPVSGARTGQGPHRNLLSSARPDTTHSSLTVSQSLTLMVPAVNKDFYFLFLSSFFLFSSSPSPALLAARRYSLLMLVGSTAVRGPVIDLIQPSMHHSYSKGLYPSI